MGRPGLAATGTMSGLKWEVKIPAVQVKPPVVSEVFSRRCWGDTCKLGGDMKS